MVRITRNERKRKYKIETLLHKRLLLKLTKASSLDEQVSRKEEGKRSVRLADGEKIPDEGGDRWKTNGA
jgi:hypothetical protein